MGVNTSYFQKQTLPDTGTLSAKSYFSKLYNSLYTDRLSKIKGFCKVHNTKL